MSMHLLDEGGWPYDDGEVSTEEMMLTGDEVGEWTSVPPTEDPWDDDAIALHAFAPHLLDDLDPLECAAITARFGIGGAPVRSLRDVSQEMGVPKEQLRAALGSGLAKIRSHLTA